jgi:hypothetical protein
LPTRGGTSANLAGRGNCASGFLGMVGQGPEGDRFSGFESKGVWYAGNPAAAGGCIGAATPLDKGPPCLQPKHRIQ